MNLDKRVIHHTPQNRNKLKYLLEKTNIIKLLISQIKRDKKIIDELKNQIEMSNNIINIKII